MKIKKGVALSTGLGVLAAGAVLWFELQSAPGSWIEAQTGDVVEAIYGLGSVTATQSYQFKVGVIATIRQLYVREGDSVKKGDPLLSIDNLPPLRAPFAGTVTAIPFKRGETVFPQVPLLTLMNLEDRYIVVNLEQEGALRVRPGQTARLSVESLRGQTYSGKVRTLFPGDNQFLVHIDVPGLPPEIVPGMTADVAIEVARRTAVLRVPFSSVQSGKVSVRKGRFPRRVPIGIGASDGRWIEVTSGELKAGDEVMVPRAER